MGTDENVFASNPLAGARHLLDLGDDHGAWACRQHHADARQGLPAGPGQALPISQGSLQHRAGTELRACYGETGRPDQVDGFAKQTHLNLMLSETKLETLLLAA